MGKRNLKKIVAGMTLKEKVSELTQIPGNFLDAGVEQADLGPLTSLQPEREDLYLFGSLNVNLRGGRLNELQDDHIRKNVQHIPMLYMQDVIHGYKTIYPVPLAMSCSFDDDLVERCSRMAAKECAASGTHVTIGPMVDVSRDPRWGRVVESAGEDPYLGARMAAAQVRGFQGKNLKKDKRRVAACLKHFAGYGFCEAGRDYAAARISETEFYNVVLPPFVAGIEAGAEMVMAAFNTVDGVPMTANERLLGKLLRGKMGFRGVTISDANSAEELIEHGYAEDLAEAAALCMRAQLDIDMFSPVYFRGLPQAVREKKMDEKQIDRAVMRVLRLKERLGLFENPHRGADDVEAEKLFWCDIHRRLAKEAVLRSCVLLKNEGSLLPFSQGKKVAVIGPFGDEKNILGAWAIGSNAEKTVTVAEGIKRFADCAFAAGCDHRPDSTDESGFSQAIALARESDCVLLCLGEYQDLAGESQSRTDLSLPPIQKKLLRAVAAVNPRTALLLFNGRPLLLQEEEKLVPAILDVWQPGIEGGNGIAELVFGLFSPCGKLSMSFPRNMGQIPVFYNQLNTGRPKRGEQDGSYYCSRYTDSPNEPLYPFGYGLSYCRFAISEPEFSDAVWYAGKTLRVSVRVRNESERAGREIVQLYIRDRKASVCRPVRELKDFAAVDLRPHEEREVVFELDEKSIGFYGTGFRFLVEEGWFDIFVGKDSRTKNGKSIYYSAGSPGQRKIGTN